MGIARTTEGGGFFAIQSRGSRPDGELHWLWMTVFLITGLTLFRLAYCVYLDVLPDEAYYFQWSQHLDASYYSKGPGIAWTIAFGTWVFGDNVFGLRWLSVLLAAGTGWQLFLLARRFYGARVGFFTVAVAALIPIFAVGSVLMTIDPLSVFFWVWSANLFLDATEHDTPARWALLGFAVGAGFLAKYTAALQLVSFLLFIIWSPGHRRHWVNPRAFWAAGAFAFCTLPILWWNAVNGWITVTHLQERGRLDESVALNLTEFRQFFEQQALVISPLLLVLVVWALVAALLRGRKTDAERYLLSLWAPVFVLYAVLALRDAGEANWPVPSYLGALPLAVAYWLGKCDRRRAWLWLVLPAVLAGFLMTTVLHETRWLNLPRGSDPLDRVRGWESFGASVDELRRRHRPDHLMGDRYQTTALLQWYASGRPVAYIVPSGRIENQYSFWPQLKTQPGETVLFVTDQTDHGHIALGQRFARWTKVGSFTTHEYGRQLKDYDVYLGVAK
ncbi:MAG: glycosyltransferase family 39 protein [Verrucomicrobiota bacterium]